MVNYNVTKTISPGSKDQLSYNNDAKAWKQLPVQATPFAVITGVQAAGGYNVGMGNICRVFGTSGTSLVCFGDPAPATPTTTTQNAALMSAPVQFFVATGNFITTTSEVTRVEIYND